MATAILQAAMNETFDDVSSGASLSVPAQCSTLRTGGYVLINREPFKINSISISKTGKHGGAKMHVTGVNIFTGKKQEALFMSTETCEVPYVDRKEYMLVDIDDEGFLSLFDDDGKEKKDLKIGHSGIDATLRAAFAEGKDLLVTIQSAMGQEGVYAFKEERA